MGYTTEFKGELKFNKELVASQITMLNKFMGEDIRDHEDWEKNEWSAKLYYSIDLEFNEDFTGIRWTGIEKSYEMEAQIGYLLSQITKVDPGLALNGKFLCQGKNIDDRYEIVVSSGTVEKIFLPNSGTKITCPHCEQHFYLEGSE